MTLVLCNSNAYAFDYYNYNSPLQDIKDLIRGFDEKEQERKEMDDMMKIVLSKVSNGEKLIKKGDKVGGCRDVRIAIGMFDRLSYRENAYFSTLSSAAAELRRTELSIARNDLDRAMRSIYNKSC
jgi:hypothetical protein